MTTDNVVIKVSDLQKSFGSLDVLKGINTEIKKGEVVVVIGPSGSGKPTFLRCLNRLEEPTGGTIEFNGVNITDKKVNINIHRQKMGMVFQHFNLFPHMTILKNMTIAPMKLLKKSKEEAEKLTTQGYNVKYVYNDASKPESFITMIEDVIKDVGRIDVLINNFGTSNPGKDLDFSNTDIDIFIDTVNINLRSVFMGSKEAVKYMSKQGGGSIINISSVGGLVPDISQVAYGTSKAAINYLTKLIAVHEAKNNIRCNAVLPGMTATEAVENRLSHAFKEKFLRHIPLKRMGLPEEMAAAVVYFAGDESAYTTGQILTISGGFGLGTPLYGDFSDMRDRT